MCPIEHFFLAMDPGLFIPRDQFTQRMDELVRWIKSGQRLEGVEELLIPGERGQRRAADLTRTGQVPLNAVAWTTLADVCGPLGVPLPA
jgi:LDH2 family malate/lactate/ureidoglycolate dehydrogenase